MNHFGGEGIWAAEWLSALQELSLEIAVEFLYLKYGQKKFTLFLYPFSVVPSAFLQLSYLFGVLVSYSWMKNFDIIIIMFISK